MEGSAHVQAFVALKVVAGDSNFEQQTLSLLRNRTKRCLTRRRVLNITEGSFYDPLNISY